MSITAIVVSTKGKPADTGNMATYLQYIRECDGISFKGRYIAGVNPDDSFEVTPVVYEDEMIHMEDLYVVMDIDNIESDQVIAIMRKIRLLVDNFPVTDLYPTAVGMTAIVSGGASKLRSVFNNFRRKQLIPDES